MIKPSLRFSKFATTKFWKNAARVFLAALVCWKAEKLHSRSFFFWCLFFFLRRNKKRHNKCASTELRAEPGGQARACTQPAPSKRLKAMATMLLECTLPTSIRVKLLWAFKKLGQNLYILALIRAMAFFVLWRKAIFYVWSQRFYLFWFKLFFDVSFLVSPKKKEKAPKEKRALV